MHAVFQLSSLPCFYPARALRLTPKSPRSLKNRVANQKNEAFSLNCPYCGKEIIDFGLVQSLRPFHILFEDGGNPKAIRDIQHKISEFSESYDEVVKSIIAGSVSLNESIFKSNVATLLPSFGMTRRGPLHGIRVKKNVIIDPKHVLDKCWRQVKDGLGDLKKMLIESNSHDRSRAILELPQESRNFVVVKASVLFDKLEWTTIDGSYVGRVGASKILFAVLPEIALPVDNAEWDFVFRTHSYAQVLSTMIEETNEWERRSKRHLETLDSKLPTTVTSIYNVMAMSARP